MLPIFGEHANTPANVPLIHSTMFFSFLLLLLFLLLFEYRLVTVLSWNS